MHSIPLIHPSTHPPTPIEPLPPLSLPLHSTHAHPHVPHNSAPTTTTIPFIASSQSRIVDGVHTSIGRGKREMKQQHSSTTTSQSVSRSVTQSTSQPSSLPEHCNHLHKQHPQSSIIRANHASRWLVYVPLPCSRKGCTMSFPASSSQ